MLKKDTLIRIALLRYSEDEYFRKYTDHVISQIKLYHPSYNSRGSIEIIQVLGADLAKRLLDNYEILQEKAPHVST